MLFSKLIQTPPRNDVHLGGETLAETFSDEKRAEGASREGGQQTIRLHLSYGATSETTDNGVTGEHGARREGAERKARTTRHV